MKKGVIIVIVLIVLGVVGYFAFDSIDTIKSTQTSDSGNEQREVADGISLGVMGPGGCTGSSCNKYCSENSEECDKWCNENSGVCEELMASWGDDSQDYREEEPVQPDENDLRFLRQGDGVWEKNELSFYIKDEEGVLPDANRKIIQETITSTKKSGGGYWGWNTALEELNRLYPDNNVPDKLVEVGSEGDADIVIAVYSAKDFCCDLSGEPITGVERSSVNVDSVKIRSDVSAYNIIDIDPGFLGDMMRHELGHTLSIFSHVTSRDNDLMSVRSPASVIKKGNLDDLYVKYRDRKIESLGDAREADQR